MKPQIVQAKQLKNRSWFWKQTAVNGVYRQKTLKTFLMAPFFKLLYRRKKTWSHVTPLLIVGQNPWLNLLLAWKLSTKNQEIMVWNAPGLDWWNYSVLQTETFLLACRRWFPYLDITSLDDLLAWLKDEASKKSKIIVLDNGFKPVQTYQDEQTGCWIFKLVPGLWESMGVDGLEMSETRLKAKEKLDSRFNEALRACWPRVCETNLDDNFACHYLMAEKVYWTSRPPEGTEYQYVEGDGYKSFSKEGEQLFGCASRIAQTPETFYKQVFEDTEAILNI